MDRAGQRSLPLSDDEYRRVFQTVREGKSAGEVEGMLSPPRDRTTVLRAYNVTEYFELNRPKNMPDLVADEVAKRAGYNATRKYVQDTFRKWRDWSEGHVGSKRSGERRLDDHRARIKELADQLRSSLGSSDIETLLHMEDEDRPYLWLNGEDWSLVPVQWASAVTPDVGEEMLWGEMFPALRQHLEGMPLWSQLEELRQKAVKLDIALGEAGHSAAVVDSFDAQEWQRFKELADSFLGFRQTLYTQLNLDEVELPYQHSFSARMLGKFEVMGFNLFPQILDLVTLLAQMKKDFASDQVEEVILDTTCGTCG